MPARGEARTWARAWGGTRGPRSRVTLGKRAERPPIISSHLSGRRLRIGPAACSTARSATTCVASRRVAAAYGVAHLALRTPFYVQNHDARSASTVVLAAATQPTTAVSRPWTRYTRVGTLEHRGSTFGKPAKVHRWWWTCNKRNHRTMTMTLLYRVSLDRKSRQHPSAPSRAAPGATSRPRTSMTLVTMRRRLSPGQTLRHWCQSTLGHFRHLRH